MYGKHYIDDDVKFIDSKEGRLKSRHVFVFEQLVLVCKKTQNSTLEFRSAYRIKDYTLKDTVSGRENPLALTKIIDGVAKKIYRNPPDDKSLKLIKVSEDNLGNHYFQINLKSVQKKEYWRSKIEEAV